MRHIVILQDRLRPGGTERTSCWLTEALNRRGLCCTLLLFHPPDAGGTLLPDFPVKTLHTHTGFPDWHAPGLIEQLLRLHPDTVLCMGRNANCKAVRIRLKLPGIRLVTTYRSNRHLPYAYRSGIKQSDLTLVNSHWAAARIEQKRLSSTDWLRVIPNPLMREHLLSLPMDAEAKEAARLKLDIPRGAKLCLNVANFVAGKNQEDLIRLTGNLPEHLRVILLLVGDGPRRIACARLAKRLGVGNRVRFFGKQENLDPFLQASDLYLTTSLRESLPNAVMEAQAAGLPVLAYDTAGTSEIIEQNTTGACVTPGDLPTLMERTESLLADTEMRTRYGTMARQRVSREFKPNDVLNRYLEVL